jgi:transcription-repair coupling factor (superfamily II helicase)
MSRFVGGGTDVLVATTIIENGLDIPNANTIFINQAENYGLSDLHQLRGRVGRYNRRAYAYFIIGPDARITDVAAKRLKAIEEYGELGTGFRIAMRNLEIRGAGNILGAEQSGHIAAVGYDMYVRLLERATKRIRDGREPRDRRCRLDLMSAALIPSDYVPSARDRVSVYRAMSRAADVEGLAAVRSALEDRYGPVPREVEVLMREAEVRMAAAGAGVESIVEMRGSLAFTFDDLARAEELFRGREDRVRTLDDGTVHYVFDEDARDIDSVLALLHDLLDSRERAAEPYATARAKES